MREQRYRNYTFLIYPESAPKNWMQILEEEMIPMYLSKHFKDKDLGHSDEDRKDHCHAVVAYDSPKPPDCLDELIKRVNGVKPPPNIFIVKNLRSMCRYLTHLDQPEKYPYYKDKEHKVIELNGVTPYDEICKSKSETKANLIRTTKDIIDYAYKNHINNFSQMCKHCSDNDLDEWLDILMWQNSLGFSSYFKNTTYINGYETTHEKSSYETAKEIVDTCEKIKKFTNPRKE